MNSAAVIGRQLRQQQNTGRNVPPGKGRQRAPSHQPLSNQQMQQLQQKAGDKKDDEKEKESTLQSIRNKVTIECLWLTCKALSSGMILLIIGTTMSVVGFYADSLSTEIIESGNSTIEVTDQDRHYHLHNLTYVGPVIMGLGGFVIVAAFVMTFEGHDSGAKVVPIKDDRTTVDNSLLTSLLIDDHLARDKQNGGPSSSRPFLCVPQPFELSPSLRRHSVTFSSNDKGNGGAAAPKPKDESTKTSTPSTTAEEPQILQVVIPNGPSKEFKPRPSLPLTSRDFSTPPHIREKKREMRMKQLCLDEFVPSPQDIEILDPDGCDTPRRSSRTSSSMDMEVYVSNCPITVRVHVEPRHLASMESDGLSDSDISDPGEISRISRRDFDFPEQEMPLLGRCSPASSSPELRRSDAVSSIPLLKRDSSRRFPLLRQAALDSGRGLDCQSNDMFT